MERTGAFVDPIIASVIVSGSTFFDDAWVGLISPSSSKSNSGRSLLESTISSGRSKSGRSSEADGVDGVSA